MIKNLKDFELGLILESIVQLGDDFVSMLNQIEHPISYDILAMSNQENRIDTQQDMKDIEGVFTSQIPDEINYKRINKSLNNKDRMKVGKFLKKINSNYSSSEIEQFVIAYKSISFEKESTPIIIQGEDLRKAFLIENVVAEVGDYATNCLRYESCQEFLDLFVENKDVVKAVVIKNEANKILARALLWTTDSGDIVMDRIYSVDISWKSVLRKWANNNGYYYRAKDDTKPFNSTRFIYKGNEIEKEFFITLKKFKFQTYPYLDTFFHMSEDGVLSNVPFANQSYYELRNSMGLISPLVEYEWWMNNKANNEGEIKEFLDKVGIIKYTINSDLSVDVHQKVNIVYENLRRFPVTFNKIDGSVILTANKLESLEGLPNEIFGDLDISNNLLRTFEYCPQIIHGDFDASECYIDSMKYAPREVKGDVNLEGNYIKFLDGLPKYIGQDLNISNQKSNAKFTKTQIREISKVNGDIII